MLLDLYNLFILFHVLQFYESNEKLVNHIIMD